MLYNLCLMFGKGSITRCGFCDIFAVRQTGCCRGMRHWRKTIILSHLEKMTSLSEVVHQRCHQNALCNRPPIEEFILLFVCWYYLPPVWIYLWQHNGIRCRSFTVSLYGGSICVSDDILKIQALEHCSGKNIILHDLSCVKYKMKFSQDVNRVKTWDISLHPDLSRVLARTE
jgi:hypothetical protein